MQSRCIAFDAMRPQEPDRAARQALQGAPGQERRRGRLHGGPSHGRQGQQVRQGGHIPYLSLACVGRLLYACYLATASHESWRESLGDVCPPWGRPAVWPGSVRPEARGVGVQGTAARRVRVRALQLRQLLRVLRCAGGAVFARLQRTSLEHLE